LLARPGRKSEGEEMITGKDFITTIIYIVTVFLMVVTGGPWQALMTFPFYLWALWGMESP